MMVDSEGASRRTGPVDSLHGDPRLHLGEVDADAALARPCAHVNRGAVRRFTQPPGDLRLRMMADGTVVDRGRAYGTFWLQHDRLQFVMARPM
jgi:hypothetical protein